MSDLTEIALDALDRFESDETPDETSQTDTSDSTDTSDGVSDAETTETSEENDTGETDVKSSDDEPEQAEDSEKPDEKDGDVEDEDGEEEKEEKPEKTEEAEKDKELSDEEFEELARKRGYSKKEEPKESSADNLVKPRELDADTWNSMPLMNKYIYSKLPYVTVHGKDGDIQIKTPDQLPDDFEFANDKARARYINDIQAQENHAQQMANAINNNVRERRERESQQENARNIISQIDELQKSGDLPRPKAKPNTPEFDNDPAVKVINNVLNYQMTRESQGYKLSIRDALLLYKAEHPKEFTPKEAKGDEERRKVAKRISGNNKSMNKSITAENNENKLKYYRYGMSTQDVLDRALQDLD